MDRPVYTLRYLTAFRCIAERCEDTCCRGMQILLGPKDHQELEERLGHTEEGRADLERGIDTLAEPVAGHRWRLQRDEGGACTFLVKDGLCALQERHGEVALPDTCALFPRVFAQSALRVDMAASLACPEAARLCLLGGPGAVDRVQAPSGLRARRPRHPSSGRPPAEDVLRTGVELLEDPGFPTATRLIHLAELGARIEGLPEQRLRAALDSAHLEAFKTAAEQRLAQSEGSGEPVIQALLALLTGLQKRGSPRLDALLEAVLPTFQVAALQEDPRLGQPDPPAPWAALWRAYLAKRERAESVLGEALGGPLERYWINDWLREPYTRSPSLLAHAFRMILRGAVLKFLLVGHPEVDRLVEAHSARPGTPLPEAERERLGAAVVETVQIFARHIETDADLLQVLEDHLTPASLGTDPLGRARLFARAA
jgi:lysine-N-methylase